ncbi:MAG: tripartite tricarboxylate transporter TctB family protein [Burkholderiales bacterium]
MFERGLNVFWIVLGTGAAAHAWTMGLVGPSGPESGLFPLLAGLIIAGAGVALLLLPSHRARTPAWPRGAARGRVLGVIAGLALMAIAMPFLGFATAGAITMIVLLRTVERSSWLGSLSLAIGSVGGVMWLFGHVLGMALPRGPWGW